MAAVLPVHLLEEFPEDRPLNDMRETAMSLPSMPFLLRPVVHPIHIPMGDPQAAVMHVVIGLSGDLFYGVGSGHGPAVGADYRMKVGTGKLGGIMVAGEHAAANTDINAVCFLLVTTKMREEAHDVPFFRLIERHQVIWILTANFGRTASVVSPPTIS